MVHEISIRRFTDEYYLALGRFIAAFSEIEGAMQVALWHFSSVKSPVAQAVFSGIRADEASNKITRISNAEGWSDIQKSEWKLISDRLGILRQLRNDIIHYGAEWHGENSWLVSNKMFVHTADRVKTTPVSPSILEDAIADLEKLSFHLFTFIFGDQMTDLGKMVADQNRKTAWRYISPPQAGHRQTTQNESQGQSRQPES